MIRLVNGVDPFSGKAHKDGTCTAEEDSLASLIETFGPMPKTLLARGKRTRVFLDGNGNLTAISKLHPARLETFVDGEIEAHQRPSDMAEANVPVCIDFLKSMLALDPDERKSASQMLGHPWLKTPDPSTYLPALTWYTCHCFPLWDVLKLEERLEMFHAVDNGSDGAQTTIVTTMEDSSAIDRVTIQRRGIWMERGGCFRWNE